MLRTRRVKPGLAHVAGNVNMENPGDLRGVAAWRWGVLGIGRLEVGN